MEKWHPNDVRVVAAALRDLALTLEKAGRANVSAATVLAFLHGATGQDFGLALWYQEFFQIRFMSLKQRIRIPLLLASDQQMKAWAEEGKRPIFDPERLFWLLVETMPNCPRQDAVDKRVLLKLPLLTEGQYRLAAQLAKAKGLVLDTESCTLLESGSPISVLFAYCNPDGCPVFFEARRLSFPDHLPANRGARVVEPLPEDIHFWEKSVFNF